MRIIRCVICFLVEFLSHNKEIHDNLMTEIIYFYNRDSIESLQKISHDLYKDINNN
jgi:hypothetical protein